MKLIAGLTPADWPAVSALLDEALALAPGERNTFVAQLDGARAQYRDTLLELLAQATGVETGAFLATLPRLSAAGPAADDALAEPAVGATVGPYRLLSELGAGGMGTVWLAERADGTLKRKVALKLPRLAWGRGLAERMARERDILASLEHPHIARLYDAGVDQHGRPYLALEYVEGQPIDLYVKERGLSVRDRLDLLLQVAGAVAFAHSRLVVHRDLKPSNILVTADGQVRLLDFGIAKLMAGDRTRETHLTQLGGRALTPDYASPEQIKGEPIGTASDVYSLGVVAYELLTGARPYRLKRGSAAELEEAIATVDALRASEVAGGASAQRALRGDLDAILNKALKKNPLQRYATIDALAQDLIRYLAHEPVSAQPDSFSYRAAKLLARHKVQAIAGVAVIVSVAVGMSASLWQAAEATRERNRAVAAADEAQRNAQRADTEAARAREQESVADQQRNEAREALGRARDAAAEAEAAAQAERRAAQRALEQSERASAVQRYLVGIFSQSSARQADPKKAQAVTARELLDLGAQRLDTDLAQQASARQEMAFTLSTLYGELGVSERSVPLARTALALAEELYGIHSIQYQQSLVRLFGDLREGPGDSNDLQRATALIVRSLDRPAPASEGRVSLLLALAIYYSDVNRPDALDTAERALREARALGSAALVARAEAAVGRVAERRGDFAMAERYLSSSIDRSLQTGQAISFDLTVVRATLANVQAIRLRSREAEATMRALMSDTEARLGPDHLDALQLRFRLGALLIHAGRAEDALHPLRETIDRLARQGPDRELLKSLVMMELGYVQRDFGEFDEAQRLMHDAIAIRDRLRPGSPAAATHREDFAETLAYAGRSELAESLLAEAEKIRNALGEAVSGRAGLERRRARQVVVLRMAGRFEQARQVLDGLAAGRAVSALSGQGELSMALLRSAIDLDMQDPDAAASRLQQVRAVLAERVAPNAVPSLERAYRLQCGRLARWRGDAGGAETHFAAVEQSLSDSYTAASPIRTQLRRARQEAVQTFRSDLPNC